MVPFLTAKREEAVDIMEYELFRGYTRSVYCPK